MAYLLTFRCFTRSPKWSLFVKIAATLNRAQLPDNIDALKALLSAQWAEVAALQEAHSTALGEAAALKLERDVLKLEKHDDKQEIVRLTLLLAKLKRALFGQKSEKLTRQIDQLQLELEELHINQGERAQKVESVQAPAARPAPIVVALGRAWAKT